ncbi:hypothetical protein ALO_19202 [Acetonema longum DSM 6540]|uniref:Uncharacterized protein n=1 Tax=Acetonema longum DSM 6540 TaxID=1009370 RepID=F7NNZ9_9FIRM|nr:hypothetical protein ALO_19202 [Acetonema longum DSM 6540]
MYRAAARAARRRGSSIRIRRPASQGVSKRAKGTRVVLPAPGGAVNTRLEADASAVFIDGSVDSIGRFTVKSPHRLLSGRSGTAAGSQRSLSACMILYRKGKIPDYRKSFGIFSGKKINRSTCLLAFTVAYACRLRKYHFSDSYYFKAPSGYPKSDLLSS